MGWPPGGSGEAMTRTVFRGRCVLPDGERSADVVVDDGADRLRRRARRPGGRRRAGGRRGAAAGPGRHPCARQRARPYRVGGLRHRRPARPRPAASRRSSTCHSTRSRPQSTSPRWRSSSGRRDGQCYVDVGFWGGAVPGNLGRPDAPCTTRASSASSASCCRLGRRRVPAARPRRSSSGDGEVAAFDGLLDRARRGRRDDRCGAAARPARLRRLRRVAPARGRRTPRSPRCSPRRPATGARVHILHLSSAGVAAAACAAPSRRRPRHRGDLPALSDPGRRARCPDGATAVQVLPADPGRRQPGRALAGPRGRDDRHRGVRPLAVDRRTSSSSTPATSARPGAASPRCSSASRSCGPAAAARGHGLVDVARWMASRPAELAGLAGKGRIAVGGSTPTWSRFAPDATFAVDPARLHHRHPVTPYAGRTLPGVVRQTWLRGDASPRRRRRRGADRSAPTARGCTMTGVSETSSPVPLPAFTSLPDLASRALAGSVIAASDELFAAAGEPDQAGAVGLLTGRRSGTRARSTTAGRPAGGATTAAGDRRLGDGPARRARCRARRGRRHGVVHRQLPDRMSRSRACRSTVTHLPTSCSGATGRPWCRSPRPSGTRPTRTPSRTARSGLTCG